MKVITGLEYKAIVTCHIDFSHYHYTRLLLCHFPEAQVFVCVDARIVHLH